MAEKIEIGARCPKCGSRDLADFSIRMPAWFKLVIATNPDNDLDDGGGYFSHGEFDSIDEGDDEPYEVHCSACLHQAYELAFLPDSEENISLTGDSQLGVFEALVIVLDLAAKSRELLVPEHNAPIWFKEERAIVRVREAVRTYMDRPPEKGE